MNSSQNETLVYNLSTIGDENYAKNIDEQNDLCNQCNQSDQIDQSNLRQTLTTSSNNQIFPLQINNPAQNTKKQKFIEVGTEVTIEENKPAVVSLQMTLLFNLFWLNRLMTEEVLIFLAQNYKKFPILFRHVSEQNPVQQNTVQQNAVQQNAVHQNAVHQNTQPKYIGISLAFIERISLEQNKDQRSEHFLTPIPMTTVTGIKIKHFKFVVTEENGILILTNPTEKIKYRYLSSLTDREVFGTAEFYKGCPNLRNELRQRFGCFC